MVNYENPPITEVVCEFVFAENTEWDSAIPGLIYAEAKERFPIREQRSQSIITCPITPSNEEPKATKRDVTVFLNNEKNIFIQVGSQNISLNQLKPYSKWEDFKNNIVYIFNIFKKLIRSDALESISLQYTNLIEIPGERIDLDTYFEIRPFLGKQLPQGTVSFIIGCIFMFHEGRDTCKVTLTDTISGNKKSTAFVLNMDYSLLKSRSVPIDQTLGWIETAHEELEKIFDGCTSDRLKDLFGVVK